MERILGAVAAVVLALIAMAGVALAIHHAFTGSTSQNVVSDMTQVVENARQGFEGPTGYTNFTTANEPAMITSSMFPSDMVQNGNVVDAWGNPVTLAPANNNTEGVVTFGGGGSEDAGECATVVVGLKDYISLSVGGTTFTPSTPPDKVSAGNACSAGLQIAMTFQ